MPVWMAIALIAAMLIAGAIGFVRERIKPAADPDALVLAELQKAGSDLRQAHVVDFFLLFRTFERATTAAGELAKAGFTAEAHSEAVGGRWIGFFPGRSDHSASRRSRTLGMTSVP